MGNKIIASLVVAVSVSFAAPVFASGYGPAPFYQPAAGAPTSQRGQSAQTIATEFATAVTRNSYGSDETINTQAGSKTKIALGIHNRL
ncbi:hypothetical protein PPGU19_071670 (plasmid) [Paraburkholderia sp. PGU19]|uniref:hypothetical protein n=1 Tax=Paraburkholderia sp. PGU19 TaxID=2735434 RepID=UPI0015DA9671|nr:hypothetical protein [Paraburkholderia sp. PGU19]BCG02599.1 hypothetical protein PPGU19_071670 [Paraburkholderia sp. PGU19]